MKKIFYLLLFAFCGASGWAMEYKDIPTAQKIKHKDLTFAVTFDNYSTRADLAKGKKDSLTMADVSFLLRGAVGFDSKQGLGNVCGLQHRGNPREHQRQLPF